MRRAHSYRERARHDVDAVIAGVRALLTDLGRRTAPSLNARDARPALIPAPRPAAWARDAAQTPTRFRWRT